ncbi:MAG: hypothetical protein QOF39_1855 [Frankiales bacterium]|jgi:Sporulation and spore germination|nr:hypothetical protein [Frankiales bacterium]
MLAVLARLLARLIAGSTLALPLIATAPAAAVTIPTVVAVRAAHHPGYDRLVLQLSGGLPTTVHAAWKTQILHPQTGLPVPIAGHAFAEVSATPAQGHSSSGHVTLARRITFALPNLTELVVTEDFEAHVTIALGLQRHTSLHVTRLTSPSRLVIDVGATWATTPVRDYFLDVPSFDVGHQPYLRPVSRPVASGGVARQALERLFAGPTPAEKAAGLRFVASGATGFSSLSISQGIARVRLTGTCHAIGAFSIANEIEPTLRQFASVHWVKIYDQLGHTESPTGQVGSIPACLEP